MVLFYSPPPPRPADVVFQDRVVAVFAGTCVQAVENISKSTLQYSAQVVGTENITLRAYTGKVIPMRAVNTSLKKKFRQERMSNFEREYSW